MPILLVSYLPQPHMASAPPSGSQGQLVCSGCRTLLVYLQGADNVWCALCSTVTAVPPPATEMAQLICGDCRTLLMYVHGATNVHCSCCHTVNLAREANQVAHVTCGGCATMLMYPYGTPSIKCAICQSVTATGMSNVRMPLPAQRAPSNVSSSQAPLAQQLNSGKQPDWTHIPFSSASSGALALNDGDLSARLNGVIASQHLHGASNLIPTKRITVLGSSVMSVPAPPNLFDSSLAAPFQMDGFVQSHWSKARAPPAHSVPISGPSLPIQNIPLSRPIVDLNFQLKQMVWLLGSKGIAKSWSKKTASYGGDNLAAMRRADGLELLHFSSAHTEGRDKVIVQEVKNTNPYLLFPLSHLSGRPISILFNILKSFKVIGLSHLSHLLDICYHFQASHAFTLHALHNASIIIFRFCALSDVCTYLNQVEDMTPWFTDFNALRDFPLILMGSSCNFPLILMGSYDQCTLSSLRFIYDTFRRFNDIS